MATEPGYESKLSRWREDRDHFFEHHYATPLSDDDLAAFSGLRYYPPNHDLVFRMAIEPEDERVRIESSAGSTSLYPGAGFVVIPFAAGPIRMRVLWGEDDDLFVPFRDRTSGATTYSGGRYVAPVTDGAGMVTVDFNKAVNPYCAYDPEFSCPLPPAENWLAFPVEAGELDFSPQTNS